LSLVAKSVRQSRAPRVDVTSPAVLQRLVIKDNADEVAEWVAQYVVARIKGFAPTAERPFVLGLPTGSSPLSAYKKVRGGGGTGRAHAVPS
jgi:hypothetical protein